MADRCQHNVPLEEVCRDCAYAEALRKIEIERLKRIPNGPKG